MKIFGTHPTAEVTKQGAKRVVLGTCGASLALLVSLVLPSANPALAHDPTCSGTLGIAVHGQHVVGDYVAGTDIAWPPQGGVGQTVAGGGAAVPGGPGPGSHFPNEVAPGASFCLSRSQSPGAHLGP
jgi:hypothetical protein